nr:family 16 glycosylhydrolase [Pseudomonadota bacterium]
AATSCTLGTGQTLPAGLSLTLTDSTCRIAGTPESPTAEGTYTITATNSAGNIVFNTKITVNGTDTLVWSDEFTGDSLNTDNWDIQLGNGCPSLCGWGNEEQQFYTNKPENLRVSDGMLEIVATDSGSGTQRYESARIRTFGKQAFVYPTGGTLRVEARMTLPGTQGLWPAFWMLPEDQVYGGWPMSGEIDIMEGTNLGVGGKTTTSWASHFGVLNAGYKFITSDFANPESPRTVFHTFAIEWSQGEIRWYINDRQVSKQVGDQWHIGPTGSMTRGGKPFDQKFHILLNAAIGGRLPGATNTNTVFPQTMRVDWVRVYNCGENREQSRCFKSGTGDSGGETVTPQTPQTPQTPSTPPESSETHESVTLDVTSDTTMYPNTLDLYIDSINADSGLGEEFNYAEFDFGEADVAGRGKVLRASTGTAGMAVFGLFVGEDASPADLSAFAGTGFIEFDIRVTDQPDDTTANILFKYEIPGQVGADVVLGRASTFTSTWRRVRIDLNNAVWSAGGVQYNLATVTKILWLPTWTKGAGTVIEIDNVILYGLASQ